MKNKNLFKFGLVAFAISCFGLSFTSATSFKLQIEKMNALQDAINNGIIPIHFADNGNDFGGFMYFSNSNIKIKDNCIAEGGDKSGDRYDGKCDGTQPPVFDEYCPFGDTSGNPNDGKCEPDEGEEPSSPIYPSGDENPLNEIYEILSKNGEVQRECQIHVKGFYYNAERGERLWPLDEETWSTMPGMEKLKTDGGIYTACRRPGYLKALCEECEGGSYINGICEPGAESSCEGESCPNPRDPAVCAAEIDKEYAAELEFYGQVQHKYPYQSGQNPDKSQKFGLVIGTTYDFPSSDWVSIKMDGVNASLGPTFVMFEKMVPMGLVYDYNGGVGFAGCEIIDGFKNTSKSILKTIHEILVGEKYMDGNGKKLLGADALLEAFSYSAKEGLRTLDTSSLDGKIECNNIGVAANSLIKVIVEGLVGMNRESDFSTVGNQLDPKMQYFSSSDINNATILNYAKKKSEELCRGKWRGTENLNLDGDVVCLDLKGATFYATGDLVKGKTLIVKDGDVVVEPEDSWSVNGNEQYYDIFVNNGNLLIDEKTGTRKFVFNTQGFIDNVDDAYHCKTANATSSAAAVACFKDKLKNVDNPTNYESYMGDLSGVGSLIRGNFIVDGHVKGASQTSDGKLYNKYFIHGKFTTRDSFKDLENTFLWRCGNGYVVDKNGDILNEQGRYCPPSISQNGTIIWMNPYESASLVVIDQNYDSPLYW